MPPRRVLDRFAARWLITASLLLIAALGAGAARSGATRPPDASLPQVQARLLPLAALALAAVAALAVLAGRGSRGARSMRRAQRPPRSRLANAIVWAVTAALVFWALQGRVGDGLRALLNRAPPRSPAPPKAPHPAAAAPGGPVHGLTLGVLVGVLVALVVGAFLLVDSRRAARRTSVEAVDPDDGDDDLALPDRIAAVAAAGAEALARPGNDARGAVLSCYAAMESTLARRGAGRRPADTPTDLLLRAETAGAVAATPARRLTALFTEARFSTHRIGPDERAEAVACLARLRQPPSPPTLPVVPG